MNITLFSKAIVRHYDHYVYRLKYDEMKHLDEGRLQPFALTPGDMNLINASRDLRRMIAEQPEYMSGLGFRDDDGNVIGHAFLMTRGGTEVLYKIRNIDAYLFAVRVFEQYRGFHYACDICTQIIENMHHELGIDQVYLTVKKDNIPARKTYEKLGFEIVGERSFHRIPKLDLNIPYHVL